MAHAMGTCTSLPFTFLPSPSLIVHQLTGQCPINRSSDERRFFTHPDEQQELRARRIEAFLSDQHLSMASGTQTSNAMASIKKAKQRMAANLAAIDKALAG
jgi:hypothetical protein